VASALYKDDLAGARKAAAGIVKHHKDSAMAKPGRAMAGLAEERLLSALRCPSVLMAEDVDSEREGQQSHPEDRDKPGSPPLSKSWRT